MAQRSLWRSVLATGAGLASIVAATTAPVGAAPHVTRTFVAAAYTFNEPDSIATNGTDTWVANYGDNSVTEFNSSGGLVKVLKGGDLAFDGMLSITIDHGDLFVANYGGNSVTEFSASSGNVVRVMRGSGYSFAHPLGVVATGADVWVLSERSVTEVSDASGPVVRVLSGSPYDFSLPLALTSNGTDAWVANSASNTITEFAVATGKYVATLSGSSYDFDDPSGLVRVGSNVWVASCGAGGNCSESAGAGLTEFSQSSGAEVNYVSGTTGHFAGSEAIVSSGSHLWVAANDALVEASSSTGKVVATLSGSSYGFDGACALALTGNHLWVTNCSNNSVTEVTTTTGAALGRLTNS